MGNTGTTIVHLLLGKRQYRLRNVESLGVMVHQQQTRLTFDDHAAAVTDCCFGKAVMYSCLARDRFGEMLYTGTMVGCVAQLAERWSLAGELTLSCARPAADG